MFYYFLVQDDGINEEQYIYVCSVDDSVIWLGFSFAYKGLLQIIAMFMAFHTRKVKIKALNESKETAAIIYINSIILLLMILNVFIVEEHHQIFDLLFSLALLVQATLFLGILFIPKVCMHNWNMLHTINVITKIYPACFFYR